MSWTNGKKQTTAEYITKAVAKHGNAYDYSNLEYINSKHKVLVGCRLHGDFYTDPRNHLQGSGCPVCANNVKLTTAQFIQRANSIHDHKYTYTNTQYDGAKSSVLITCSQHGDFEQVANDHLNGNGCPTCALLNAPGVLNETIVRRDPLLAKSPRSVYLFHITTATTEYWKVGISNNVNARAASLSSTAKVTICQQYATNTLNAILLEKHIHENMRSIGAIYDFTDNINGGATECFRLPSTPNFMRLIHEYNETHNRS